MELKVQLCTFKISIFLEGWGSGGECRDRLINSLLKNIKYHMNNSYYSLVLRAFYYVAKYLDTFQSVQLEYSDQVKFVMCTLVSRTHMTFYLHIKGNRVHGNHGKLNQIHIFNHPPPFLYFHHKKVGCCLILLQLTAASLYQVEVQIIVKGLMHYCNSHLMF